MATIRVYKAVVWMKHLSQLLRSQTTFFFVIGEFVQTSQFKIFLIQFFLSLLALHKIVQPSHHPARPWLEAASLSHPMAQAPKPTIVPRLLPPWRRADMAARVVGSAMPQIYSCFIQNRESMIFELIHLSWPAYVVQISFVHGFIPLSIARGLFSLLFSGYNSTNPVKKH